MNCLGPEPQTPWTFGRRWHFVPSVPGSRSGVLVPFDLRSVPFVHQIGGIIIPSAIKQSQAKRKSFEEKVVFSKDSICFLRKLFQNGGWFNFDCFFKNSNSLFDGLDGAGSGPGLIGRSGELCCCWGSK